MRVSGNRGKSAYFELPIDTGSLFTWIEKEALQSIGVKPSGARKFRTIEGREISRQIGEATLELKGKKASSIVVFGEKGDASVLGVNSLEGLGFEVDLVSKKVNYQRINP